MRLSVLLLVGLVGVFLSPALAAGGRDHHRLLQKWKSLLVSASSSFGGGQSISEGDESALGSLSRLLSDNISDSEATTEENRSIPSFSYGTQARSPSTSETEQASFLDNSTIIAIAASAGALLLIGGALFGLRTYMMGGSASDDEDMDVSSSAQGQHKIRPGGLSSIKGADETADPKGATGRLQGARTARNGKILVPQDSKVDSTRSTNENRGDFFTLTDIDLVSPGKGKYTSPRV